MNSPLVTGKGLTEVYLEDTIEYVLDNNCKWVNISGGEPTETDLDELIKLIKTIKLWGCKVGMATNGINVDKLRILVRLLDYVALDIKTADWNIYHYLLADDIKHVVDPYTNALRSLSVLMSEKFGRDNTDGFDYEIRTTLYPPFIDKESLNAIGGVIDKEEKWVLQQFRHAEKMLVKSCYKIKPYSASEAEDMLTIAKKYSNKATLRYV